MKNTIGSASSEIFHMTSPLSSNRNSVLQTNFPLISLSLKIQAHTHTHTHMHIWYVYVLSMCMHSQSCTHHSNHYHTNAAQKAYFLCLKHIHFHTVVVHNQAKSTILYLKTTLCSGYDYDLDIPLSTMDYHVQLRSSVLFISYNAVLSRTSVLSFKQLLIRASGLPFCHE